MGHNTLIDKAWPYKNTLRKLSRFQNVFLVMSLLSTDGYMMKRKVWLNSRTHSVPPLTVTFLKQD